MRVGKFLLTQNNQYPTAFSAYVSQQYSQCIASKETEFTCKAYINTLETKRSADEANSSASMAAGMSAASMGFAAGGGYKR